MGPGKGQSNRFAFLALVLALVLSAPLQPAALAMAAQVPTGNIEGTVLDANGAVVPEAAIAVTQKTKGRIFKALTNGKGAYALSALEPGVYEIKVTAAGFKTALLNINVEVGETATGSLNLEVGELAETVTVTGGTENQIDLARSTVSGVVNTRQIENLPLNGRNFLDLAALEPGVQTVDGGSFDPTKNGFTGISVAGSEGRTTRIQVDGIDITDEMVGTTVQNYSLDALQEFQISQFTLDPSTSLSNTGAVNVATRSGDNQLHGSSFIFWRDSDFAARIGQLGAQFDREQGGLRVGGPLKKDKLFWFFNFEKNNQDSTTFLSPPAPFNTFEGFAASPFDERSGTARLDWNATGRLRLFTRFSHNDNRGVTGFGGSDLAPFENRNNTNSIVFGADMQLERFTHSLRYGHVNFANYINPASPSGIPEVPVFILFTDTGVQFGPDFLAPQHTLQTNNELRYDGSFFHRSHVIRYGMDHNRIVLNVFAAYLGQAPIVHTLTSLQASGDASDPLSYLPIDIVFGNGLGFFSEKPTHDYQFGGVKNDRFAWYLNDSWKAHRNLTVNLGIRWEIDPGQVNDDLSRPAILDTVAPGESRKVRLDQNNFAPSVGFAWDVMGRGTTVIRGGSGIYYSTNIFNNVIYERAALLPNTIAPALPFVFDSPGFNLLRGPNGEVIFDFNSVSSRPLASSANEILAAQMRLQALSHAATSSFPSGPISLLPPDGLPGTQNTVGALLASEFSQPYSIQTNIGVQRQISNGWLLQLDYVRNRGVHTTLVRDYNRVGAANTFHPGRARGAIDATLAQFGVSSIDQAIERGATIQDFATNGLGVGAAFPGNNPNFGNLRMIGTQGLSTYNGLQLKITGRTGGMGRFLKSVDWGISYALSRFEATQTDQAYALDAFDNDCVTCLYGPVNVDRTHQLTVNTQAELPWGFRWSAITRIATAVPVTLRLNPVGAGSGEIFFTDLNGDGFGMDVLAGTNLGSYGRDIKGGRELNAAIQRFNQSFAGKFTPASMQLLGSSLFTEGQLRALGATIPEIPLAPVGQVGIDSFLTSDFRLSRVINIKESVRIEPSVDIFNVFNFANYDPPGGFAASIGPLSGILGGIAGTVNGTRHGERTNKFGLGGGSFSPGIPRSFQFGLRVTF
jgi:hypothetical protein